MDRKYFGTDGIRGEANKDLTLELSVNLGLALGYYLKKNNPDKRPKIVLGSDTRISGYMIRSAISAGITAMGVSIDFVGVIPTPAICYLTREKKVDAGVMISASHNPIKDNGIKIFDKDGNKLDDSIELLLEQYMSDKKLLNDNLAYSEDLGRFTFIEDDMKMYRNFLKNSADISFKGIKLVIDTGNGAAYRVASRVFQSLGAQVVVINNIPDGRNINVNCGSTHPELLQKMVVLTNSNLGLAYDGDADRLIAVDEKGNIVDGDKIIGIIAMNMKSKGVLNNNTVVTTVQSNLGFEKYLNDNGIKLLRANVGDRYVLEKMKTFGLNLGGEQSGHIIIKDYNSTGDGVLSSIQLVQSVIQSGRTLGQLCDDIKLFPQKMNNIHISKESKQNWKSNKVINDAINYVEKNLDKRGRVLIRASGTEPVLRVMVEADNDNLVMENLEYLTQIIEKELK